MVAAAVIGAGALSAGASILGSSNAADAQTAAADKATQAQLQMYNQTRADLSPYNQAGQFATNRLQYMLNNPAYLNGPTMDQATLEKTPGYQFNLYQGLKSTQNSAAARGLGSSGAALKGAASFATGLADSTYQNQFNNAVMNQTNAYNRLMGLSSLGESAAAKTGAYGTQTGSDIGQNMIGAGNAQAAAWNNGANALGGAFNNAGNLVLSNKLLGGALFGK